VRQSRKLEHLKHTVALDDGPGCSGFKDLHIVHNCLPDLAWKNVTLTTNVAGITLKHPVIINAITGGADDVAKVNWQLAELANRTGAAMAVGSQFSALENPEMVHSYKIVRKANPKGIIFANLGAHTTPEDAKRAVKMVEAAAIQIHLNAAQELIMKEGDRDFRGYLANIQAIVKECQIPVIVKEVGCGIAAEQAKMLIQAGVKAIDIGGRGGTNFLAIEAARAKNHLEPQMLQWGIATAVSAIEVSHELPDHVDMVVSGGVRSALDAVKALAIGAKAVAIAGPIIKCLENQGLAVTETWFLSYLEDIKRIMLLTGTSNIAALANIPLVITGQSYEWLRGRGVDPTSFAKRCKTI